MSIQEQMPTCVRVFILAELRLTAISYEGAQIWQACKNAY